MTSSTVQSSNENARVALLSRPGAGRLTVSLKTLALALDAHRSSVRRWLKEAGIRPVALGRGRNGAIRYLWADVESWLATLERVD